MTPSCPPLRIALIQTQAENAGAQEISRLLAEGLGRRGHAVVQIFFFRRTASFDGLADVVFCGPARPSNPWALGRLLLALRREVRRRRIDVAVTFQHFGNLFGAPVARLGGARHVVANQNTPSRTLPRAVRLADRLYGIAGLYDRIVVNSALSEAEYGSLPRPYAERVVRIDHGFADKSLGLGKADARRQFGLPADMPLLGCVARLHPGKNLGAALRTLALNPSHHLALAGQGTERQVLVDLARDLGVGERLHLLGELPSNRVGVLLAALDAFVFPSRAETFGLAAAEAAQAGVPVISNDLPVMREVLAVDGEPCALFVDADDTPAFAAAIRRLLGDDGLAARLTARGKSLQSRFPLEDMVQRYAELIEGLR